MQTGSSPRAELRFHARKPLAKPATCVPQAGRHSGQNSLLELNSADQLINTIVRLAFVVAWMGPSNVVVICANRSLPPLVNAAPPKQPYTCNLSVCLWGTLGAQSPR